MEVKISVKKKKNRDDKVSTSLFKGGFLKLYLLMNSRERLLWSVTLLFAIFNAIVETGTALIIVAFADIINGGSSAKNFLNGIGVLEFFSSNFVVAFCVFAIFAFILRGLVVLLNVFLQNSIIQRIKYRFKIRLLDKLANRRYIDYLKTDSAYGNYLLEGTAEQTFSTGLTATTNIISELVIFLALCSMLIYLEPNLFWLVAILYFISYLFIRYFLPKFYLWGKSLEKTGLLSTRYSLQFFQAFREIILAGKKNKFMDSYHLQSLKRSKLIALNVSMNNIPRVLIETLFVIIFMCYIIYSISINNTFENILLTLGGYLYAGFRIMPGINRIIVQLNLFKTCQPFIETTFKEIFNNDPTAKFGFDNHFQFEKQIEFQSVCYNYEKSSKKILKNVNLKIIKGESIGLKGETGSGKTTLINLLLGMIEPTSGSIKIDGSHAVNTQNWHQRIGLVSQDFYLFDDSIAKNIALDNNLDHQKLKKVIKEAQLDKFISKLPRGINTNVGEGGSKISGGERQRIAIARALYKDPEVIIFDEATSALDVKTEEKIMNTIYRIGSNRTIILVAHRLSTLKNCDRVFSINNGFLTAASS